MRVVERTGRGGLAALAALLLGFASPDPAGAQLGLGGAAVTVLPNVTTRGSDAAFDPANARYLVVGAFGSVRGVFVDTAGNPIGSPFTISSGAGHANFPRVEYSAAVNGGSGGFLVVWTSEDANAVIHVRTRVVAASGALIGSEQAITDSTSYAWLEAAPAVAYSETSQKFFVAWQGLVPNIYVKGRLVGLDGAGVGPIVQLSSTYARDPGVAWNPNRDEFGVSFSGEGSSGGYSALAIVPASNPAGFRRTTFNQLGGGSLTYITDLDFSTETDRFLMTWYEAIKTRIAEFDEDGNLVRLDVASFRAGIYDSLSLAFNPVSQTLLLVGLDPQTDNLNGVELNGHGVRLAATESAIMSGPAYYARVAASQTGAQWDALIAKSFVLTNRIVVTSSTNGGGAGTGGSSSGDTGSGGSTSCPGGPIPGMTCVNGNWMPDTTSSGGSTGGASCPGGPVPGMTCINGNWIPDTTSSGGSTGGTNCPGGPIPGMTCVNGNWMPDTSSSGGSFSSLPVCVGGSAPPASGWVRIGLYDWVPPDHPYASQATCRAP